MIIGEVLDAYYGSCQRSMTSVRELLILVLRPGKWALLRTSSSAALVDILINESRYSEALDIAERLFKYPGSIIFNWGKAEHCRIGAL